MCGQTGEAQASPDRISQVDVEHLIDKMSSEGKHFHTKSSGRGSVVSRTVSWFGFFQLDFLKCEQAQ